MTESNAVTTIQDNVTFNLNSAGFAIPGTDLIILNPDPSGLGEVSYRGR